jgi:phosphatidylserine decarboxylase
MSKTLKQWLGSDVAKLEKKSVEELGTVFFFRDPSRPMIIDNEHFYSPADGVILYQRVVDADEKLVEIKGINYTVQDTMQNPAFDKKCLVIGIFMSFFDVHINRIPYGGILTYNKLDSIESTNRPMLALEKDILNEAINPNNLDYVKNNERMLNTIYVPSLDYTYYVVQIADEDVDVICHFSQDQNESFAQNERFSHIRWGSQCELILPLDDRYEFELCEQDHMHIEAGVDKLVRLKYKNSISTYGTN